MQGCLFIPGHKVLLVSTEVINLACKTYIPQPNYVTDWILPVLPSYFYNVVVAGT